MVKVLVPEMNWHGREAVYSVHFHPDGLLATGGMEPDGSGGIKLWKLARDVAADVQPEYLTDLEAHAKPVNCVRFSPDGTMLASASVDGTIIIWKFDGLQRRWMQFTQLLIHTSDVVDLCWSPNSQFLFSGSMDDTAIVWDINATGSAKVHLRFSDHQQYVQGVAWDPLDQVLLSVSSDRSVNAYKPKGGVKCSSNETKKFEKKQITHRSFERSLERSDSDVGVAVSMDDAENADLVISEEGDQDAPARKLSQHQLFLSDLQNGSQFRRTSWSPDGSFFIVPSGQLKKREADSFTPCSYIFNRKFKPVAALPCGKKPSVVASCCPVMFKRTSGLAIKSSQMNQQHKIVWAIATSDSILVYHSECPDTPMLVASDLHYFSVTDLAWSHDGRWLIASSRDGFCTIISFSAGELGEVVKKEILPQCSISDPTAANTRGVNDSSDPVTGDSSAPNDFTQTKHQDTPAASVAAPSIPLPSSEIFSILEPPSLVESTVRDCSTLTEPPKKKRIAPTLLAVPCVPVLSAAPASVAESFGLSATTTLAPPPESPAAALGVCSVDSPQPPLATSSAATPLSPTPTSATPSTLDKALATSAPSSSGRKRVQPTLLSMLGVASNVQPLQLE